MNIMADKSGSFSFLLKNFDVVNYEHLDDIPEDLDILEILCFMPNFPPPPHTLTDHEVISDWHKLIKEMNDQVYGKRLRIQEKIDAPSS